MSSPELVAFFPIQRPPKDAIARALGISRGRLWTLEHQPGRMRLEQLWRLAAVLGVRPVDIIPCLTEIPDLGGKGQP